MQSPSPAPAISRQYVFGTIGTGSKIHAIQVIDRRLYAACGSGKSTLAHNARKPALQAIEGLTAADVTCSKCRAALAKAAAAPASEPAEESPVQEQPLNHNLVIGDFVRKFGLQGKVVDYDGSENVVVEYLHKRKVCRQSVPANRLQKRGRQ